MELSYQIIETSPPAVLLKVSGRVDGSNYTRLVDKARGLLQEHPGDLLLSLRECDYLSSAGLFALHNIALIANQLEPLNQEEGWGAFRQMANEHRELKQRFKIIEVPQNIMNTLEITGLASLYDIHPDMQEALLAQAPVK